MDYYLDTKHSLARILEEYKKHSSLIVAFDFDDTVYDFHQKGRLYTDVITLLRELKHFNCYLICWTGQSDLGFVENYLIDNAIPFDNINEHAPFRRSESRKIYANVYLDDRAGLQQVYQELNHLITHLKQNI